MRIPVRLLAVAAVFGATLFAGSAAAQTVMARSAPPGEKVEVFLNGKPVGSGTADGLGDAKIPVNMNANLGKAEMDANIYVDGCEKTRRVWIVEVGQPAPTEGICNLRTVSAVFWVRTANTIVVDVSAPIPRVLLVVGSYRPPAPGTEERDAPRRALPKGLIVFGGPGYGTSANATSFACGNTNCSGDDSGLPLHVGAEYRFSQILAAEASYTKIPTASARGSGSTWGFTTEQKIDAYTLDGKIGFQAGPARIYGKIGTVYQQSKNTTTQTQQDITVTVDGEEQTIPGGLQTLEFRTDGWNWMFGGGFEIWPTSRLAVFAEFGRLELKGDDIGHGEFKLEDSYSGLFAGVRFHVFK